MKRVIVMILSLAVMLSGTAVFAADAVPVSGYTFVDIAYNGKDTYVALAKATTSDGKTPLAYSHLYYSTDKGLTWTRTTIINTNNTNDFTYGNPITSNPQSQQQLVYWEKENVFVVHAAKVTLVSSDGITWDPNSEINWTAETMITAGEDYLVLCGGSNDSAVNAQGNLTNKQYTPNKCSLSTTKNIPKALAVTPKDSNGNVRVFTVGLMYAYHLDMNSGKNWTLKDSNSGDSIPMQPYDMIYAEAADQFLFVDGTEKLYAAYDSNRISTFTIKPNVNVTGINASDKYIVAGMSDGTMYYTENAPITGYTVWTEIKPLAGASAGTEPVKNFAFSSDSEFVALGTTQIYKGSIDGYCNVSEYGTLPQISTPDFSQEVISQNDGYHAKTASFEITQANDKIKGVKVTVNGESQTKSLANVDATMKFGIILISDNAEKLDNAQVSVQMLTE